MKGIDGIHLDCFEVGQEYEVGNSIGALFLAEGWAEPVPLDAPAPVLPFAENDPFNSGRLYQQAHTPPNLEQDRRPPYLPYDVATAFRGRKRSPRK
jgi:hypothetical protein